MAGAINKILVPIDGSKNSLKGMDEAIKLSKVIGSSITGLFVYNSPISVPTPLTKALKQQSIKEVKQILSKAKSRCEKNKIKFNEVLLDGSVGPTIVNYARVNNYDYVVMSSRGMSPPKEFFLGSVSNHVLHTSKIPVILVR